MTEVERARAFFRTQDFLMHYGVKGMKWGVRKERDKTPRKSRKERKADKAQAKYDKRASTFSKLSSKEQFDIFVQQNVHGSAGVKYTNKLLDRIGSGKARDLAEADKQAGRIAVAQYLSIIGGVGAASIALTLFQNR